MPTYGMPHWLLGSAYTVRITPQDVSSGGVFTDNAIGSLNFYGKIDEDSYSSTLTTQNLTSLGSFNANPVPLEYDGTYSLTEIMQALPFDTASGTVWGTGNILEKCLRLTWYHKISITADTFMARAVNATASGGSALNKIFSYEFYALMTELRRVSPKGKNLSIATFKLIAVGDGSGGFTSNPALDTLLS